MGRLKVIWSDTQRVFQKNDSYYFYKLAKQRGLIQGISTRILGSKNLQAFADKLSIRVEQIVRMNQVHGDTVVWVSAKDAGQTIKETDALLTSEKGLFLTVLTADCVPILLYDPIKEYIGVIHAGWRGLYNEIIGKTVKSMISRGSDPKDIIACIGPCIRSCCYTINEDLAVKFRKKFKAIHGNPLPYIVEYENKTYMNLPYIARIQLEHAGILDEEEEADEGKRSFGNIEDADICTADNLDTFYSYRKEGEEAGRFISLIGMRKE